MFFVDIHLDLEQHGRSGGEESRDDLHVLHQFRAADGLEVELVDRLRLIVTVNEGKKKNKKKHTHTRKKETKEQTRGKSDIFKTKKKTKKQKTKHKTLNKKKQKQTPTQVKTKNEKHTRNKVRARKEKGGSNCQKFTNNKKRRKLWDRSPAAGKSLMSEGGCGNTPRSVARVTARSGVSNEDNLRVPPRSQDGLEGL